GGRTLTAIAWCSQAVMQSAEELVEASTGIAPAVAREPRESGFESERVATFLDHNAQALEATVLPDESSDGVRATIASRLHELAASTRGPAPPALDDLDRTLTVLEEKLFTALQLSAGEAELVDLKTQADRELAPYRAKMSAVQLRQV